MYNEITVESGHNKKLYIFAVYEIKQLHPIWETSNILFDEIISRKFNFENYQA